MHVVARAPNHLGDGVMALPAMHALARVARVTIQAPVWGPDLYRDVEAQVVARGPMPDADVAVLFPPSLRVAWQARRIPRRIGVVADARGWLLTDRVGEGVHQADTYAALVAVLGAQTQGAPVFASRPVDEAPDVPEGHIGLNPISKAGAVRQWPGFSALAGRMTTPVVFYGGPGEAGAVSQIAGRRPQQVGLSLPSFAMALRRCIRFVSNDSGAAHFARACGVETVVVYGSTTPERTGPAGSRAVSGTASCRPCYGSTCRQRRWWRRGPAALSCLELSVESVAREVLR